MQSTPVSRGFCYNNQELGDPNPSLSPEQVKEIYAATRPELATAGIEGPEIVRGRRVYRFVRQVGTKG